jgi:hypothetical protein
LVFFARTSSDQQESLGNSTACCVPFPNCVALEKRFVYILRNRSAKGRAIPGNDAPWPNVGTPPQDDHIMAVSLKCAGKNRPNLSGSP